MSSEEQSPTTLHGKTGHIVCHGAIKQINMGMPGFVAIFVVRTSDQWVICVSHGLGDYDWEKADEGLGTELPGEQFAPLAQRGLPAEGEGAVSFAKLHELMDTSFMNGEFHWFKPEEGTEKEA